MSPQDGLVIIVGASFFALVIAIALGILLRLIRDRVIRIGLVFSLAGLELTMTGSIFNGMIALLRIPPEQRDRLASTIGWPALVLSLGLMFMGAMIDVVYMAHKARLRWMAPHER